MKYPDNRKLLSTPTGAKTFRFLFLSEAEDCEAEIRNDIRNLEFLELISILFILPFKTE